MIHPSKFTSRELQVISMVASGSRTKDVAIRLGITHHTAEAHRQHAMAKANWQSVVELTHWALAVGVADNQYARQVA